MKTKSKEIGSKQKKIFYAMIAAFLGIGVLLVSFTGDDEVPDLSGKKKGSQEDVVDTVSQEIDPEALRMASLEKTNDRLNERLQSLESSLQHVHQEKLSFEKQQQALLSQARDLEGKVKELEEKKQVLQLGPEKKASSTKAWERTGKKDERHVSFEIPAGTVLKAVLVSGADCSVAVSKPTGPNMMLLRPLDNGQLPRKVRVPLKGSVILGNAIGDISSERVYIRAERMTLVEKNGSFIETEISGYVSGEDGREGMRGVVVDRSGKIVARAAFAALFQGIGQGLQAAIDANVIHKITERNKENGSSVILNSDMFRPVQQGTGTAFGKLTDYYIKRSEQLQPTIQIAAGRVVDVVFTKSVKIGEKDLKKKFEMQRAAKREEK